MEVLKTVMKNDGKAKKVLFVDDDEIHLTIVSEMLEQEYEVFTAKSGQEALSLILKGLEPDIILLDILMPKMDGWEVFYKLRTMSLLDNIPIAFFTSLEGSEEEERARIMGVDDYIKKPCERRDLIQKIEGVLSTGKK